MSFARDVTAQGSYAYIAGSAGMRIVDVSDPANPVQVGSFNAPGTRKIAVSGTLAYIADSTNGMEIVNVADPANPALVAVYKPAGSVDVLDVSVSGNTAYIAYAWRDQVCYMTTPGYEMCDPYYYPKLEAVDVTDPANPVALGTLTGSYYWGGGPNTMGLALSGNHVYLAEGEALLIVDISNPASLSGFQFNDFTYSPASIAVSGNYAYVGVGLEGIKVIDVSNPAGPFTAATYDTPGNVLDVAVAGGYAYLADANQGMQQVDITDPLHPRTTRTIAMPGYVLGVASSGDRAYLVNDTSGLHIYRNETAGSYSYSLDQVQTGVPDDTPEGTMNDALFTGVADGEWYFHVKKDTGGGWSDTTTMRIGIDTVKPEIGALTPDNTTFATNSPTLTASYTDPAPASGIAGVTASLFRGGTQVTLNQPCAAESTTAQCSFTGLADDQYEVVIAVTDNAGNRQERKGYFAVVANPVPLGLHSPTHPDPDYVYANTNPEFDWAQAYPYLSLRGSLATDGNAFGVAVSGNYAYVTDRSPGPPGLRVIDISDPGNPLLAGSAPLYDYARKLAVSGNYLYVTNEILGLQIFDITNPVSPILAGTLGSMSALDVAVSGDYAYVVDRNFGLRVVNITDKAHPALVGSLNTGSTTGVAISGNYAYLSLSSAVMAVDVSNPAHPVQKDVHGITYSANDIALSGNYVYVAASYAGLAVFNITNPADLVPTGTCDTPGYASVVSASGNYVYVGENYDIRVINVADAAHPVIADSYRPGQRTIADMAISDNRIFITNDVSLLSYARSGFSYTFDQNPGTVPDTTIDTMASRVTYSGVPAGDWYMHLSRIDAMGNAGEPAHLKVRISDASPCSKPDLSVTYQRAFWASYADYLGHSLSVDYSISNNGANGAFGAQITGSVNTQGVTSVNTPLSAGSISAGTSVTATVRYNIPSGVTGFTSWLSATASDSCGGSYSYPQ